MPSLYNSVLFGPASTLDDLVKKYTDRRKLSIEEQDEWFYSSLEQVETLLPGDLIALVAVKITQDLEVPTVVIRNAMEIAATGLISMGEKDLKNYIATATKEVTAASAAYRLMKSANASAKKALSRN